MMVVLPLVLVELACQEQGTCTECISIIEHDVDVSPLTSHH